MIVPSPTVPRLIPHFTAAALHRMSPHFDRQHAHGYVVGDDLRPLTGFYGESSGISIASVGLIEGIAEAADSLSKIDPGAASDSIRRRKPLVIFRPRAVAVVKRCLPLRGLRLLYRWRTASLIGSARVFAMLRAMHSWQTSQPRRSEGRASACAGARHFWFRCGAATCNRPMNLVAMISGLVFSIALIPRPIFQSSCSPSRSRNAMQPLRSQRWHPIHWSDITALPAASGG